MYSKICILIFRYTWLDTYDCEILIGDEILNEHPDKDNILAAMKAADDWDVYKEQLEQKEKTGECYRENFFDILKSIQLKRQVKTSGDKSIFQHSATVITKHVQAPKVCLIIR